MKSRKLHQEKSHGYPIEQARKILQDDGTFLTEDELQRFVDVLTLIAQQEKELFNSEKTKKAA